MAIKTIDTAVITDEMYAVGKKAFVYAYVKDAFIAMVEAAPAVEPANPAPELDHSEDMRGMVGQAAFYRGLNAEGNLRHEQQIEIHRLLAENEALKQTAIDAETRALVIELCDDVRDNKYTWSFKDAAENIKKLLGA